MDNRGAIDNFPQMHRLGRAYRSRLNGPEVSGVSAIKKSVHLWREKTSGHAINCVPTGVIPSFFIMQHSGHPGHRCGGSLHHKTFPVVPLQVFNRWMMIRIERQQNLFSIKLTQRVGRIIFRNCRGNLYQVIFCYGDQSAVVGPVQVRRQGNSVGDCIIF